MKGSVLIGRVEKYLLERIHEDYAVHITLVDPEKVTPKVASRVVQEAESCDTAAIMIGGSTLVSSSHLDTVVKTIKKSVEIPVILFPNNVTGISRYADAIWFMSLLNSSDPYFLVGAQVLGAPLIKKFGLEPIPMGYLVIGEGSTVGVIGKATPIPPEKPELAVAYTLAAQYFGMRFVYLEAGSGVKQPVPIDMIRVVKSTTNIPLIVGGGIKNSEQAREIVQAGADIIVTGTVLEEPNAKDRICELIENIKNRRNRKNS